MLTVVTLNDLIYFFAKKFTNLKASESYTASIPVSLIFLYYCLIQGILTIVLWMSYINKILI